MQFYEEIRITLTCHLAEENRLKRCLKGGLEKKGNFSTSKASKVRSRWGGLDLKGGVEYSILPGNGTVFNKFWGMCPTVNN